MKTLSDRRITPFLDVSQRSAWLTCLAVLSLSAIRGEAAELAGRPPLNAGGLSPRPAITKIDLGDDAVELKWRGGGGPYQVQKLIDFINDGWTDVGSSTFEQGAALSQDDPHALFRVVGAEPDFAGAERCELCHSVAYKSWSETHHAHAFETLSRIGQQENDRCLACHTVGLGFSSGFIDEVSTPHLAGVQCENCHGPSGAHADNPFENPPPLVEMSSEMCGGCHSGFHHPTYEEWHLSNHAKALTTISSNPFARESCLRCHSQDYRYAVEFGKTPPTIQTASLSLECSTCHESHGDTDQAHLLKAPVGNLCGECHSVGESRLGSNPHHPQYEMLLGKGAFRADGSPLEQLGSHTGLALSGGEACARCHVISHEAEDPTLEDPIVTGHTFNPFDDSIMAHQATQYTGCAPCHDEERAQRFRETVQADVQSLLDEVGPFFDSESERYVDPSMLEEAAKGKFDVAKFNYRFVVADKSLGVHNPANTKVALRTAKSLLEELTGTAETPVEGESADQP